jgi:hypothetical protein
MTKIYYFTLLALFAVARSYAANVEPVPAPPPPAGPTVILTAHALDGHGGTLEGARIGVVDGKITTLSASMDGDVIDLRGYTVLPGWIDTHVHLGSHFDRMGRIATESESPMDASLGIARAAFEFTVSYLRGEVPGGPPAGAARQSPQKQMAVAEMRIKLEQAEAIFLRAASQAKYQPSKDERLRAYAAHYTVMEFSNDICQLAIRTCGGRSISRKLPLEQLFRDSRCGSLMLPWTPEICLERLGRESLFEPGEK